MFTIIGVTFFMILCSEYVCNNVKKVLISKVMKGFTVIRYVE